MYNYYDRRYYLTINTTISCDACVSHGFAPFTSREKRPSAISKHIDCRHRVEQCSYKKREKKKKNRQLEVIKLKIGIYLLTFTLSYQITPFYQI